MHDCQNWRPWFFFLGLYVFGWFSIRKWFLFIASAKSVGLYQWTIYCWTADYRGKYFALWFLIKLFSQELTIGRSSQSLQCMTLNSNKHKKKHTFSNKRASEINKTVPIWAGISPDSLRTYQTNLFLTSLSVSYTSESSSSQLPVPVLFFLLVPPKSFPKAHTEKIGSV